MNTLPDEIVRKIADMKIAADYCSLTVYDDWGALFWVSRCFMDAPWFCRIAFPNYKTQIFIRSHGFREDMAESDMVISWSQVLTLRTKAALERLVKNVFTERARHAEYADNPVESVTYYYSQADGGVPPTYMACSLLKPWQNYKTRQDVAPDAMGGHGDIRQDDISGDDMEGLTATESRVKLIMEAIEVLVAMA
jgi:hypothetical protein